MTKKWQKFCNGKNGKVSLKLTKTRQSVINQAFCRPFIVHYQSFRNKLFYLLCRDGQLKRREFRDFRKIVKGLSRNKVCARHFWQYCDMQSDGRLTKSEWSTCLGLDTSSKLTFKIKISGLCRHQRPFFWQEFLRNFAFESLQIL